MIALVPYLLIRQGQIHTCTCTCMYTIHRECLEREANHPTLSSAEVNLVASLIQSRGGWNPSH